ncbi:MAG: hypothetical protein ACP5G6_08735, partial [Conexivisphaera sp.]
ETHIIENLKIPRFNPKVDVHRRIAELSRRAHELAACVHARAKPEACEELRNPEEELRKVEDELDRAVAELYGIPEYALADFRGLLEALSSKGSPRRRRLSHPSTS